MTLEGLFELYDGNAAITITHGLETVYLEQGLENILSDESYPTYAGMEIAGFGIRPSETDDAAPVLRVTLKSDTGTANDDICEYVRSAWSLAAHISKSGLVIAGQSGMDGGDNIIRLPDKTTFNWKSRDRIVRINCKEPAMRLIESDTGLRHIPNGRGDPARPYSFIIDTYSDLAACLAALGKVEKNRV